MPKKKNTALIFALSMMLLLFFGGAASFFLISVEAPEIKPTIIKHKESIPKNLSKNLIKEKNLETPKVVKIVKVKTINENIVDDSSPKDIPDNDNQIIEPGQTDTNKPRKGFLDKAVIQRVVKRHINEIKYCYEKELVRTIGLKGKIIVSWLIKSDGKVSDVKISKTTLKSERVESCIIKKIKRWIFPKPKGGGDVKIKYPFNFKINE